MDASRETSSPIIIDRAGRPVDISGSIWSINDVTKPQSLNFEVLNGVDGSIITATQAYFKYLIQNYSCGEILGNWYGLTHVWNLAATRTAGTEISYLLLSQARDRLGTHEKYRFHYVRKWFKWCCSQGFDGFSREVVSLLDEIIIGGNAKGDSVLSADPEKGPLVDSEIVALTNALRAARMASSLTLGEQTALWLCVALGMNAGPLALLREEDFEKLTTPNSTGIVYQIRVPRHKKRASKERGEFRIRKLNRDIGSLIEALIAENRAHTNSKTYAACGRPLLKRHSPRKDIDKDSALLEYRFHYTSKEVAILLARAVDKLEIISPRTGRSLKVSPRRLRYTYATRLVHEGAPSLVVADALDHTDLQNVSIYFDIKSDIVPKLDRALVLELGPVAQAFLGQIVRRENEAVRGDRRTSRIYYANKKAHSLDPIGTCGSFSFCNLFAPIACYTCVRFQPWMDAPHDKALQALLDARQQRIDAGLDDRMVTIFDNTIFAIADVIHRIELIQQRGES